MNFTPLTHNLTGVVAEMCLKMGMALPNVSLNYPTATLNALLGASLSQHEMSRVLEDFCVQTEDTLGGVTFTPHETGFCLTVPGQGVRYAMQHAPGLDFLRDLVHTVGRGCTFEELLSVFRKYSGRVHVQTVDNPEFDHLVYFEDGKPDGFYYCVHEHDGRVEYHRFSKADYEAFGF